MSFQSLLAKALSEDEQDMPSSDSMYEDSGSESDFSEEEEDNAKPRRKRKTDETFLEDEDHSDLERQMWGKRRQSGRGKRRVRRRTANPVPPEYAQLMGEANAAYISGDHVKAISMLKDFVKKAPTVPDPYHTLGVIYEKLNDRLKAIQFFLIACSLTPTDASLWRRVGSMAKEEGNSEQATYCYKMATQADPKDVETLYIYAEMCKEGGDNRRAAEALKKIANLTPEDLSVWLQVAECYHANSQDDDAIEALVACIEQASDHPDGSQYELHAVNMVSDLFITLKRYDDAIQAIEALHRRRNTSTSIEEAPTTVPLDIAVKYGICHLYRNHIDKAQIMFEVLFQQDVDIYGDLYIDVAEAYVAAGPEHDSTAIEILQNVLLCPTFTSDKVFAMLAHAYERQEVLDTALQFYDQALEYQTQTKIDPRLVLRAMNICYATKATARGLQFFEYVQDDVMLPPIRPYWAQSTTLSTLSSTTSKPEEENIEQENPPTDDEDDDEDDDDMSESGDESGFSEDAMENIIRLKLFLIYARLHWQQGEPEALCKVALPVILLSLQQTSRLLGRKSLLRRMHKYYDSKSLEARDLDRFNITHSHVLSAMKDTYLVNPSDPTTRDTLVGIVMRVTEQVLVVKTLTEPEYVALVRDVCRALCEVKKHICAVELLIDVNCSNKISAANLRFELRFLALSIALAHKENRMAYECVRLNILEEPENYGYWNLFGHVINQTGVFSWHQKFLAKILRQHPKCYPAMVLAGLHSSASDSAQLAVGELTLAHLQRPDDPLALFCIGLSYLNMSMFRTVVDRQLTVAKAFAFFQLYQEKRFKQLQDNVSGLTSETGQVESWYNIGRAYHQLELNHLAIAMYERVLRFYEGKEIPPEYQLCRETAYNLSLIYKQSGAVDLARYLTHTYLTVE
ncbi:hypothetical protein LEN26_003876 [Aphanomyces euteiches]|nr:hypothetical protein LEN26_003876 [Aphanomyces euteiches]